MLTPLRPLSKCDQRVVFNSQILYFSKRHERIKEGPGYPDIVGNCFFSKFLIFRIQAGGLQLPTEIVPGLVCLQQGARYHGNGSCFHRCHFCSASEVGLKTTGQKEWSVYLEKYKYLFNHQSLPEMRREIGRWWNWRGVGVIVEKPKGRAKIPWWIHVQRVQL